MEKELDDIINSLPNGIIDNFIFYASKSFNNKLESYKGIKIIYLNIIKEGEIYYTKNFLIE